MPPQFGMQQHQNMRPPMQGGYGPPGQQSFGGPMARPPSGMPMLMGPDGNMPQQSGDHGGNYHGGSQGPQLVMTEKKPKLYLLVTRLAAEVPDSHVQQVLDQCGEVQGFRRGRDAVGVPLSFGVAQFGDPEAAWKAVACLSKKLIAGQEVKVLVEESAELIIQKWRESQRIALKVTTDEELDWELERKSVSCKALIDAKLEELFGPAVGGDQGGAQLQRRQELREREAARIDRVRKRKTWRDSEFSRELEKVESEEKRLRVAERESDEADRAKEEQELKEKEERDTKLEKLEQEAPTMLGLAVLADNRDLVELVDKVQSEPREDLFRICLDASFLRSEKILERKLRPWLEKKIDIAMGGQQSDLVEWIIRRVNSAVMPDAIISELSRYIDENAEPLVERMWRMLAFELTRNGLQLTGGRKKTKKEDN